MHFLIRYTNSILRHSIDAFYRFTSKVVDSFVDILSEDVLIDIKSKMAYVKVQKPILKILRNANKIIDERRRVISDYQKMMLSNPFNSSFVDNVKGVDNNDIDNIMNAMISNDVEELIRLNEQLKNIVKTYNVRPI